MAPTARPATRVIVVDTSRATVTDALVTATRSSFRSLKTSVISRIVARLCRALQRFFHIGMCSTEIPMPYDPYRDLFSSALAPGVYAIRVAAPGFAPQSRRITVIAGRELNVVFILARPGAPAYYRRDMKVPFEPHDVVAVALKPGHWQEDFLSLAAASGIALHNFDLDKLTDVPSVRSRGIQLFRVAPNDRQAFEAAARRHQSVEAVGSVVSSTPYSVSLLTNEFIVQFADGSAGQTARATFPYPVVKLPWAADRYVASVPQGQDSLAALESMNTLVARELGIRWASPNLLHTLIEHQVTPPSLAVTTPKQPHHDIIDTRGAHALGSTGANTTIAVVDLGCDTSHPDFAGRVVFEYDFLLDAPAIAVNWHGTACTGIAAGAVSASGFFGVAPDAGIVAVSHPNSDDLRIASLFHWLAGVDAFSGHPPPLASAVDVVSCSWTLDVLDLAVDIEEAFEQLEARQTVVVFSAGNIQNGQWKLRPVGDGVLACYPTVVAAGSSSTVAPEHRSSDSRYGTDLDLVAPAGGENVASDGESASTFPIGNPQYTTSAGVPIPYGPFAQTSCACAQIAGVAALVRSADPSSTAAEVRQILFATADPIGKASDYDGPVSDQYGYGRVNANRAVASALGIQPTTTSSMLFSTASRLGPHTTRRVSTASAGIE